jgi:hypothetical protein
MRLYVRVDELMQRYSNTMSADSHGTAGFWLSGRRLVSGDAQVAQLHSARTC